MQTATKMIATSAAALLIGGLGWNALAESAPASPKADAPMHMQGSGGMGYGMMGLALNAPTYLASVKDQLGITETQEPAWNAYKERTEDVLASLRALQLNTSMAAMHDPKTGRATMTKLHDQHRQAVQTIRTAADKLVASLNDTQTQIANQILPGLAPVGHGMMGGMGMMGMMGQTGMMDMGVTR